MSSKCPVINVVFYVKEWKFKEAYMKCKCGEYMSAKEREQEISLQNLVILG